MDILLVNEGRENFVNDCRQYLESRGHQVYEVPDLFDALEHCWGRGNFEFMLVPHQQTRRDIRNNSDCFDSTPAHYIRLDQDQGNFERRLDSILACYRRYEKVESELVGADY